MSLRKPWKPLTTETLRSVPDRYGVYELGDEEGASLGVDAGPLQDDLKEALAYGDGEQVRWQVATSREHAESMLESHR
ncbi:DUF7508 domain-containing protein [Salinigranum halophilum]|jgi:hypothetical protein|uniref:DUF7508 domain-containing protein n=1 Tax=Salinigranum halophilum TaxID=2565931 RepID=UPI0010A9173F|nr:hypothetical protein [Salinigranum halophilum]